MFLMLNLGYVRLRLRLNLPHRVVKGVWIWPHRDKAPLLIFKKIKDGLGVNT